MEDINLKANENKKIEIEVDSEIWNQKILIFR